ncbi:hypothetical protein E2P81_ATG05990 [Venturia nashicola]|nr:hypothetical protein E2P81_ATG05990 [Venturia nashicola]
MPSMPKVLKSRRCIAPLLVIITLITLAALGVGIWRIVFLTHATGRDIDQSVAQLRAASPERFASLHTTATDTFVAQRRANTAVRACLFLQDCDERSTDYFSYRPALLMILNDGRRLQKLTLHTTHSSKAGSKVLMPGSLASEQRVYKYDAFGPYDYSVLPSNELITTHVPVLLGFFPLDSSISDLIDIACCAADRSIIGFGLLRDGFVPGSG